METASLPEERGLIKGAGDSARLHTRCENVRGQDQIPSTAPIA